MFWLVTSEMIKVHESNSDDDLNQIQNVVVDEFRSTAPTVVWKSVSHLIQDSSSDSKNLSLEGGR